MVDTCNWDKLALQIGLIYVIDSKQNNSKKNKNSNSKQNKNSKHSSNHHSLKQTLICLRFYVFYY